MITSISMIRSMGQNNKVLDGLSGDHILWAFTILKGANWFPLTWLSLQLDSTLFGPEAAAFHRTNLILHLCQCYTPGDCFAADDWPL